MLGITSDFGSISIVSEWMDMGNAHAYVQNQKNDPRPLLLDIVNGLHYLHAHKKGPIFHGDLKGLNVLISNAHRALLADFGYSTLTQSTFSMPVTNQQGGSCHWMAPELWDGVSSSAESDMWAFGMTTLV
ncbi:hypothetical protein ID866_10725, partial [Astraeus odoratus]